MYVCTYALMSDKSKRRLHKLAHKKHAVTNN